MWTKKIRTPPPSIRRALLRRNNKDVTNKKGAFNLQRQHSEGRFRVTCFPKRSRGGNSGAQKWRGTPPGGGKRPSGATAPLQTPGAPPKRVKKGSKNSHAGGLFWGARAPLGGAGRPFGAPIWRGIWRRTPLGGGGVNTPLCRAAAPALLPPLPVVPPLAMLHRGASQGWRAAT